MIGFPWHRAARVTALTLVFGGAVGALRPWERKPDLPPLPDGVSYVRETRTPDSYARDGYMELVSPIRPPTTPDGSVHINVFVKVPEGAAIHADQHLDAEYTLRVPPGTIAVRLESWSTGDLDDPPSSTWAILDVRGTSFEPQGERFFVERPEARGASRLLGLRWPRAAAQGVPTRALGDLVRMGLVDAPAAPPERASAAAHLMSLNDCAGCHTPLRAPRARTGDPGVVSRGTDASGLFQVAAVFRDRLPLETYRPRDANIGRPFISYRCGELIAGREPCNGGVVKEAVLDVRGGMRARDPHTMRVCASRVALARRLDSILPPIAAAVAECE